MIAKRIDGRLVHTASLVDTRPIHQALAIVQEDATTEHERAYLLAELNAAVGQLLGLAEWLREELRKQDK